MVSHVFLYKNVTLIFIIHSSSYSLVKDRKSSSTSSGRQGALSPEIKNKEEGRMDKNEGRERKIMRAGQKISNKRRHLFNQKYLVLCFLLITQVFVMKTKLSRLSALLKKH